MESKTSTSSLGPVVLAISIAVVAILVAILALGRALASPIGGSSAVSAATETSAATVAVELSEFAIEPGDIETAAGGMLEVSNVGQAPHNLKVKDTGVGTTDLGPGGDAVLDLSELEPGTYGLWCDIPGHESGGMTGTLTITGDAGAAAPAADSSADDAGTMDVDPHDMHGDGAAGDWSTMYEAMRASVDAFPAETEGAGGQPLEPVIGPDGVKEFTLVADETEWELEPGKIVDGIAYNGQIPGPTIKVDVGDRVRIVVDNQLDEITSWHPHGVRNHPNEADGVGFVTQEPIQPGETWTAEFVVDEQSVGMYHGHDMGLHQVPDGLAGAFLVGDVPVPDGFDVVDEAVMILNDSGNIGFSLNGKSFPATSPYVLQQGQSMVVHYLHEGNANHPMHLHGNRQLVIAKDGFPLEAPYYADTVDVAPGERYTVVVEAEHQGTWVWHCHILPHVERSDGSMFGMLTALVVE